MIDIKTAISSLYEKRPMLRVVRGYEDQKYYSFFVVARKWDGEWEDYPIGIETYYSIDKTTGSLEPTVYDLGKDDPGTEIDISAYLTEDDRAFISYIEKTREAYDNNPDYIEV